MSSNRLGNLSPLQSYKSSASGTWKTKNNAVYTLALGAGATGTITFDPPVDCRRTFVAITEVGGDNNGIAGLTPTILDCRGQWQGCGGRDGAGSAAGVAYFSATTVSGFLCSQMTCKTAASAGMTATFTVYELDAQIRSYQEYSAVSAGVTAALTQRIIDPTKTFIFTSSAIEISTANIGTPGRWLQHYSTASQLAWNASSGRGGVWLSDAGTYNTPSTNASGSINLRVVEFY